MRCNNCGRDVNVADDYCGQCGYRLNKTVWDNSDIMDTISNHDVETNFHADELLFVDKNSSYYDMKWQHINGKKSGPSFNWASLFLGFFWLGYRKMYKHIALIGLLFLLSDFVLYIFGYEYSLDVHIEPIDQIIGLAVSIFLGFYGNKLYKNHVNKQVTHIRNVKENAPKEKYALYRSNGGTAWYGPILTVLIILGVYMIPTQLIPVNIAPVDEVKYGYYVDPNETFQEIFSDVFTDGEWSEVTNNHDYSEVEFQGNSSLYGEAQDVSIYFRNIKNEEELYIERAIVNGYEYDDQAVYDYLDELLADNGYLY